MDPVELTQELVRLESINPGGSETACAELLGGLLASHGFEVQYHEFAQGRTSVAAWRGEAHRRTSFVLQAISIPFHLAMPSGRFRRLKAKFTMEKCTVAARPI